MEKSVALQYFPAFSPESVGSNPNREHVNGYIAGFDVLSKVLLGETVGFTQDREWKVSFFEWKAIRSKMEKKKKELEELNEKEIGRAKLCLNLCSKAADVAGYGFVTGPLSVIAEMYENYVNSGNKLPDEELKTLFSSQQMVQCLNDLNNYSKAIVLGKIIEKGDVFFEKIKDVNNKYFHYSPNCWTGYIERFTCSKTYLIAEFLFEDEENRQDYTLEFLMNTEEELRNSGSKRGLEAASDQLNRILEGNNS